MSKNPYKNLVNNSIAFTIANIGSKVISFIMVPLYTYVLATEQYGTIDVMMTMNSLLLPIVFLCLSDAVLRYTMDKRYDKADVLTAATKVYLVSFVVICCLLPILAYIKPELKDYLYLFGLLFMLNGVSTLMSQFLRATGHIKAYAANGVFYTFVFASMNILFLVFLNLGVTGYLLSSIVADVIRILVAVIVSKSWRYISFSNNSKAILKMMLYYSLPLIPNALMWWVMDASDKFVILLFCGIEANGLYAVSKKLPTLIDTFHGIFNQAWQLSAIEENDNEKILEFTTQIYKYYIVFLSLIASIIVFVSRPFIYLLGESYHSSWKYIPFLVVSVVFSSVSGFLSSKLIANEKTKFILKTTIIGALANIVMNFILIPIFGINGAGFATMASFFIVWKLRESLLIKIGYLNVVSSKLIFILIAFEIIIYYLPSLIISELLMGSCVVLLLYMNKSTIIELLLPIFNKGKRLIKRRER